MDITYDDAVDTNVAESLEDNADLVVRRNGSSAFCFWAHSGFIPLHAMRAATDMDTLWVTIPLQYLPRE